MNGYDGFAGGPDGDEMARALLLWPVVGGALGLALGDTACHGGTHSMIPHTDGAGDRAPGRTTSPAPSPLHPWTDRTVEAVRILTGWTEADTREALTDSFALGFDPNDAVLNFVEFASRGGSGAQYAEMIRTLIPAVRNGEDLGVVTMSDGVSFTFETRARA